jgi:hypothetical protein
MVDALASYVCDQWLGKGGGELPRVDSSGYRPVPGTDKHSRPHLPKTTAIFEAFMPTYQKICPCMIFQSTTTIKKQKTQCLGRDFVIFLFLLSIFGLHKFSKFNYLTVSHGLFHHINFSPQIIIIYGWF